MQERETCTACGGTRFSTNNGVNVRKPCWKCSGQGYLTHIAVTCNRCHGNGKIAQDGGVEPLHCPTCDGKGTVREPGR